MQRLIDDALRCVVNAAEEGKIRTLEALQDKDYQRVNELGMAAVAIMIAAATLDECRVALKMIKNAVKVSGEDKENN
jgi:hypothetical protein